MGCRFAILKEVDGEPGIFIEFNEQIFADRVKARMKEYYFANDRFGRLKSPQSELEDSLDAFDDAFNKIMSEFK